MHSTTPLRVVSILDPALDTQAMGDDVLTYAQSRDEKLIKPKFDGRLCWFYLRRIPNSLYQRYVLEAPSESARHARAFQCAVMQVENLPTENGVLDLVVPQQSVKIVGGEMQILTDAQMELFAPLYTIEIGEVANTRSFLPAGSALCLAVRGSLALVLETRVSQDAAEIQRRALQSREQRKQDTATKDVGDSEKHGAATATDEATSSSPDSETTTSKDGEKSSSSTSTETRHPSAHGEPTMTPS